MAYATYLAVLGVLVVLGRLPLGVTFRLGGLLGLAAWVVLPGYRRLAFRNMRVALGPDVDEREIRRLVRGHFRTFGSNLFSVPRLARMRREDVESRVEGRGFEHLRAAIDRGRGVVVAISHIGNWELYAQLIGRVNDVPVGAVFQPQANKHLDRLIDRTRRRLGLRTFDRKRALPLAIHLLQDGGIVSVLVDQHAGEGGIWTPLFGRLASTSPLAALLAEHTGAPIVAMAIQTVGTARWRCVIEPAIEPRGRTAAELTAGLNAVLERQVAASPRDWLWLHNRWKTMKPRFLGRTWKRGWYLPPGTDAGRLAPFRLLFPASELLGEAVMSVPAVEACKAGRPDAHVTVLAPEALAPLWRRVAAVDEVIGVRPGETPRQLARRVGRAFDVAILFPDTRRSALLARALGVPRVVGYRIRGRRGLVNQAPRFTPESGGHLANRFLRLAEYCGATVPATGPSFLRKAAPPGVPPRVGVCPGADHGPAACWPAERFAVAMREFHAATPAEWVVFGAAGDAPAADAVERACGVPLRTRVGRTTLDEVMDELAACDALLTDDTGMMHLAAFLGVPTVALDGSTDPAPAGPLGGFHRVLRGVDRVEAGEAVAALHDALASAAPAAGASSSRAIDPERP